MKKEIIDYYYNPNLVCTCGAIFADTHRISCRRRNRKVGEFIRDTIKNHLKEDCWLRKHDNAAK